MNKKMKKYFMKGTDDEVQFGDKIVLDLTEDLHNGKVKHHHLNCKFIPDLVPMLLEQDVVEEVEVDDEEEEEISEDCPMVSMIDELVKANQTLEHRVYTLEKEIKKLKTYIFDSSKSQKNAKKAVSE